MFIKKPKRNICETVHVFLCLSGHINNLYNTVFWTLVQRGGLTTTQAEDRLKVSAKDNLQLINMSLCLHAWIHAFMQMHCMLYWHHRVIPPLLHCYLFSVKKSKSSSTTGVYRTTLLDLCASACSLIQGHRAANNIDLLCLCIWNTIKHIHPYT